MGLLGMVIGRRVIAVGRGMVGIAETRGKRSGEKWEGARGRVVVT